MKVALIIFLNIFSAYCFASNGDIEGKAAVCISCHGDKGISTNSLWPNLAGQKKDYLVKQLHAFKKVERVDQMMNPIAENLSEQDIEDLSQYFSTLK